uniref:Plastocyanin-like domain-containing protein n=1 Tax=Eptatretus burgeri TaxID=7764 RepID=A0A8C4NME7_EPTBU
MYPTPSLSLPQISSCLCSTLFFLPSPTPLVFCFPLHVLCVSSHTITTGDGFCVAGKLGPILKAEVGDSLSLQFLNHAKRPLSLHAHGVIYSKASEGASYADGTPSDERRDDAVLPGRNYTYTWKIPLEVAPSDQDPPCLTHPYYSHVDLTVSPTRDIAAGLVGPLLICKHHSLDERVNVDDARFLLFSIFDENQSWYLGENIIDVADRASLDILDPGFMESNLMASINGYMHGTLPGVIFTNQIQLVSWHLASLGAQTNVTSVVFSGHKITIHDTVKDTISLQPFSFETVRMVLSKQGVIVVYDGQHRNSLKVYHLDPRGRADNSVRRYYIAAVELDWDYGFRGGVRYDTVFSSNISQKQ